MTLTEALPIVTQLDRRTHSRLKPVLALAERCRYEVHHSQHVTRLALTLFDELVDLHGLGKADRFDLQAGGLLHDIGWIGGKRSHHKRSQRLIMEADELPFDDYHCRVIGCIARYHRKSLPKASHDHFSQLESADQHRVRVLGGMVRLADDLDNGHRMVVRDLTCTVKNSHIKVLCHVRNPAEAERLIQNPSKRDLLEQALDREITVTWE